MQIRGKRMGVNYKKLWIKIAEKEMSNPQVRELAEVSASTFTKLKKNEYVSLESLVKIAIALDCEVGDLVEIVKEDE
jgi:hypothetical protein